MAWFFRIFLGIVALCAVIYVVDLCRSLFAGSKTCDGMVIRRYMEVFPLTIGFAKRDRTDRYLVFRTTEGKDLTLTVLEDIYKVCPAGTKGHVSYRGHTLTGFVQDPEIEIDAVPLPEDDPGDMDETVET